MLNQPILAIYVNVVHKRHDLSGIRQIWISPRLSDGQNQHIVDTFRDQWATVPGDEGNPVRTFDDEGNFIQSNALASLWIRNVVIDSSGRLWHPCTAWPIVNTIEETRYATKFCALSFTPRFCRDKNCTFDVWVHPSRDVGTITEKNGWKGSPDQWVHGQFTWKDVFHANYRDYRRKLMEDNPKNQRFRVGLFVHVKDGKLTFRNAFEEKE